MTNDLLRKMADGLGATGISQLAGWVGMDARVSAAAQFDGVPITLAPNPDPASDAANLIVRDATGRVVSREAMPLGVDSIHWGGVGTGGAPLPAGLYTFEQESLNRGEVTSTRPVEHYAQVREARIGEAGVEIVLVGGISVPSTGVTALRAPDSQP
jgi:flagellar basal-body rod modification protein FlgD